MQSVLLLLIASALSVLAIDTAASTSTTTTTPTALHQWPSEYRTSLVQKINHLQEKLNEFDQSTTTYRAENINVWVDDRAPLSSWSLCVASFCASVA